MNKTSRRGLAIVLILAVLFSFSLTGCKKAEPTATTQAVADATEVLSGAFTGEASDEYYMCTFYQGADYWKGVFKGFQQAGDALGVKTIYIGSDDGDPAKQVAIFEQIVAKNPKGIALSPTVGDAFIEPINKAMAQGIAVSCFASDSPESNRITWITSDDYNAGKDAADFCAKALGETGKIGFLERPAQNNHANRIAGFEARIAEKYPNMVVVARGQAEGDQTKAASLVSAMIQKDPDLALVYCSAGMEGMGAGTAVKESQAKAKVFCYDADPAVIDMVKDGTILACMHPNTVNQGFWSMMVLFTYNKGIINPISDWKEAGRSPIFPMMNNGLDIVTKDNGDAFFVK
jgi:ribose transport system substrate-binding protein